MGLYTDRPLSMGQTISFPSGKVDAITSKAKVRWCRQVSTKLYKVGLMFDSLPSATVA